MTQQVRWLILVLTMGSWLGLAYPAPQQPKPVSQFKRGAEVAKPVSVKLPETSIKLETRVVLLSVSITDKQNRPIRGLTKEDFEVYEDKSPQRIELFASEDAPLSIGVVIDRSGSMKYHHKLDRAVAAAQQFVVLSNIKDEFFLLAFEDRQTLLQDFAEGREAIHSALSLCEPTNGGTALYDAVYWAIEKLERRETINHKALIVLTDGEDRSSKRTAEELERFVGESNVPVYTIGIMGDYEAPEAKRVLKQIAELSGGRSYFPREAKDLAKIYIQIATELRHQYGLTYSPTNEELDGEWRKISVKVRKRDELPKLRIHTRKGYFAALPLEESDDHIVTSQQPMP